MNVVLGGQLPETICREDPPRDLPFPFLPFREIGHFVVLLGVVENIPRNHLHFATIQIQKLKVLVGLRLQGVDDFLKANGGHEGRVSREGCIAARSRVGDELGVVLPFPRGRSAQLDGMLHAFDGCLRPLLRTVQNADDVDSVTGDSIDHDVG